MFFSFIVLCTIGFAESKTLALQIALDREGYSCNAIDGQWGRKSERALGCYINNRVPTSRRPAEGSKLTPEQAFDLFFADAEDKLFRIETVTQSDINSLVRIPDDPAARAALPRMGYESIREMFAERAHLTPVALSQINPGVDWDHIEPGTRLVIPDFPSIREELSVWPKSARRNAPKRPEAAWIAVSLGNFEVRVYDAKNNVIALFPCSIAKNRSKLPGIGKMKIVNAIARPNYTYTPDFVPRNTKPKRFIWPEGENCPIGVAWLGLDLPGYGIHGTPRPESIGRPESHGCFRLANWNAARLYALCPAGTRVVIEP